jgi:hypothetical protein
MKVWNWFTQHGDDVFTFIALAAVSLMQSGLLDPLTVKWIAQSAALAAIAHKVFFPTPPVRPASQEST